MKARPSLLLLLFLFLSVSAYGDVKEGNIIYHEPVLSLKYSDVVHPYAWAHARPDPYYDPVVNAYSIGKLEVLSNFLETQTHLRAKSVQASSLIEVKDAATLIINRGSGSGIQPPVLDFNFEINPKGFSKMMGIKEEPVPEPKRIESDYTSVPSYDQFTGSFPGALQYRRGQYGLRRRRLPYWSSTEEFGSINPYRKLNNFFKSPQDVLRPRVKWSAAKDSSSFDLGRFAEHEIKLPYAGHSSFLGLRFREMPEAHMSTVRPHGFKGTGAGRYSDGSPVGSGFGLPDPGAGPRAFPEGDFSTDVYTQPRHFGPGWLHHGVGLHPHFASPSPYIHSLTGDFFNFFGDGAGGEHSESGSA